MNRCTLGFVLAIVAIAWVTTANAADLTWSGGDGDWDTTTANWGGATWNNATPDNAIFTGTPGTVTLTEAITVQDITFPEADFGYVIAGSNSLNFAAGGSINNGKTMVNTFTCGITGSPAVNLEEWSHVPRMGELAFAPTSSTQTLGVVTLPYNDPSHAGDKTKLTLGGTTTGNTVSEITFEGGLRYSQVWKNGTGTWALGNVDTGIVYVDDGVLVANGTIGTHYQSVFLRGGEFHFNNPLAIGQGRSGTVLAGQGGSLDNTSGAAIAVPADDGGTPVYQPKLNLTAGGLTFIGTDALDLGTGAVTLSGTATVTVQASTLTLGGAVSDGSNTYGVTKAGAGTLVLGGANSYNGNTEVSAGTLSLGAASLDDASGVTVASGAFLDLDFAGTDDVFNLTLGGAAAPAGVYGAVGSGAPNESPRLTGTGLIQTAGGIWTDGRYYWDGPNVGGDGDGVSDGGTGTWSTSNANWDKGFTAREVWTNSSTSKAIFDGPGGTVTVDGAVTVKDIAFDGSSSYTIDGGALNFGAGGSITVSYRNAKHTITSAITGSPDVLVVDGTSYDGINFAPTSGTVTLGVCTIPYEGGTGDKAGIRLGGTTTGNTVEKVINTGGHYGRVTKQGTGTWTVGDIDNIGTLKLEGGTLIVNGTYMSKYAGLYAIPSGARLGGNLTYLRTDARAGDVVVNSGGIVAPGDPNIDSGIGTITTSWGTQHSNERATIFENGSIYEWEIGESATDTVHAFRDQDVLRPRTLTINDMILKILDAGGSVANDTVELPVFTYDDGVTVNLSSGVSFDTSELGATWTIGGLALTDGGAGIVYLTGLSGGTPTAAPGDANSSGFVDDDDLAILLSNWEQDAGTITTWALGDFTGDTDIDDDDLAVLLGNWTGPPPGGAAVPEPATLALLGRGGLLVLRRRRK